MHGRSCTRRGRCRGRLLRRRSSAPRTRARPGSANRRAPRRSVRAKAAGTGVPSTARSAHPRAWPQPTSPRDYDDGAEPRVPSFVMDLTETTRPVLHPLVEELLGDERLVAYAEALPAPARVSEPALPLLLAALHEHLGRALVVLLPEDADARDAAEAARWLVGEERVALLPSRGVRFGSGLQPPPHPVRERARALDVLAAGGLVCASATAIAEALRACRPLTPRPLHAAERAVVSPAAERRAELAEPTLPDAAETPAIPDDLVPPLDRPPDLGWQPDEVREVWEEELDGPPPALDG